jgi:hypothetical protein
LFLIQGCRAVARCCWALLGLRQGSVEVFGHEVFGAVQILGEGGSGSGVPQEGELDSGEWVAETAPELRAAVEEAGLHR